MAIWFNQKDATFQARLLNTETRYSFCLPRRTRRIFENTTKIQSSDLEFTVRFSATVVNSELRHIFGTYVVSVLSTSENWELIPRGWTKIFSLYCSRDKKKKKKNTYCIIYHKKIFGLSTVWTEIIAVFFYVFFFHLAFIALCNSLPSHLNWLPSGRISYIRELEHGWFFCHASVSWNWICCLFFCSGFCFFF